MIIFVTGNSRSGTTMMSRILGNHPEVFSFQELHYFDELSTGEPVKLKAEEAVEIFARLCAIQRNGYFGSHDGSPFLKEAAVVVKNKYLTPFSLVENFLYHESNRNSRSIPCEQTPQNIFYLKEILDNIENAKVIIMVRDPREVLLSQKYKWKRKFLTGNKYPLLESIRSRINYHPYTISRLWNAAMKEALAFKAHPNVLLVHYESVISDAEKIIQSVCTHCHIAFHSSMLDIPVVGSSNFKDSQGKRGIDKNRSGMFDKGGLSTTEIYICQKQTGNLMASFGYQEIKVQPNYFIMAWYRFSQPIRLVLALFFNLKRLRHPRKLLKKFF